jgi:hypothetical protein
MSPKIPFKTSLRNEHNKNTMTNENSYSILFWKRAFLKLQKRVRKSILGKSSTRGENKKYIIINNLIQPSCL